MFNWRSGVPDLAYTKTFSVAGEGIAINASKIGLASTEICRSLGSLGASLAEDGLKLKRLGWCQKFTFLPHHGLDDA
jgi:hypothetical protein